MSLDMARQKATTHCLSNVWSRLVRSALGHIPLSRIAEAGGQYLQKFYESCTQCLQLRPPPLYQQLKREAILAPPLGSPPPCLFQQLFRESDAFDDLFDAKAGKADEAKISHLHAVRFFPVVS